MKRVLAAVVGTALVWGSVILTLSPQFEGPLSGGRPPVEPTDRFASSRDQVETALWLRDRSGLEEVVSTNRHCASPVGEECDARRFMVAAYTERAVLLEGWAYILSWRKGTPVGSDPRKPFWDRELQRLNDSFIRAPDGEAASELHERGVRWIFIDKQRSIPKTWMITGRLGTRPIGPGSSASIALDCSRFRSPGWA